MKNLFLIRDYNWTLVLPLLVDTVEAIHFFLGHAFHK
jgi:hypothetical protein